MTSKNSGKTVNSNSRHTHRKDNKKNNNNKLIPTSSDEEQAADKIALVPLNKRLQAQDKQDMAAKKARTFSEKDMELDLAAPSALPSDISSSTVPNFASPNSAVDPSAAATIITQAPESQVANLMIHCLMRQLNNTVSTYLLDIPCLNGNKELLIETIPPMVASRTQIP